MNPDDERAAFWAAVHTVDDRVTDLRARFEERDDMTLEMIQNAVRQAMPTSLLTDEEHLWVKDAIKRQAQSIAFRRKIIESAAIWAVPLLLLALLAVFREYAIAHGMWRP